MRTLTVVTVCLTIPTLITGIYGMYVPFSFAEKLWIKYNCNYLYHPNIFYQV
ncbi:MAG: hypothetical protein L0Y48_02090 [Fusobacteria bacterium]|nr:hypothetical protein [Fusobacteriota bacterium]